MPILPTRDVFRATCVFSLLVSSAAALHAADPIQHQITLPAGQTWCEDSMIHGLLTQVNALRAQRGLSALKMDPLGMKVAEVRATEFIAYMSQHSQSEPGFNPHTGWDLTAARLGYNIISENLAYISTDPAMIVGNYWNDPLHMAAMLAGDATIAGVSCVYAGFTPFWTFEPGYCTGSSCGQTKPSPTDPLTLSTEQWAFLTLINNYRAQNGLGPLAVSAALQRASQWHSEDMAAKNYASHTDSLGRSVGARLQAFNYTWSPWGENIAGGYGDAQNTFNQWLNACDPDASGTCTYAHRKNMLGAGFTAIGIGRASGSNSSYGWYWTTDFGGYVEQRIEPGTPTPAAPVIASFTATPSSITAGQSATLTWNVTGATSVSIDNAIGSVTASAMRAVSPAQTTTYRLTAKNSAGSSTASVTVTVQAIAGDRQAPAAPTTLTATAVSASEIRLSWKASTDNVGVTGYQILRNGTVLGTTASLSYSDRAVQPASAYTYQVKAYDGAGNFSTAATAQLSTPAPSAACGNAGTEAFTGCYYGGATLSGTPVLVRTDPRIDFRPYGAFPPDAVPYEAFSVLWRGNFAFEGGTYTFSSMASDGMRVYVDGALVLDNWRDQPPRVVYTASREISAGTHLIAVEYYSRSVTPAAHLSWTRSGGTTPSGPAISSFTASPASVTAGQPVTLTWNVTGATSVSIDHSIGSVPAVSSRVLSPSATTTFTLTATNGSSSTTAKVTVTVSAAARDTQAPTTPGSVTAVASGSTEVKLTWQPASDNVGVAGYRILRNGSALTTVPHPGVSYKDSSASPNTAYTYSVAAYDGSGNVSTAAMANVTTPAASSVTCGVPGSGVFHGCFYANKTLSGTSVLSRSDKELRFDAAAGFPPAPVPRQGFSARWEGTFSFEGGTYMFSLAAADGIRMYIDGVPAIERWFDQPLNRYRMMRILSAGTHRITVEYYAADEPAVLQLSWQKQP